MPEGLYKFSYSTTLQVGLLGEEFTTGGSGILVFHANRIIGFVNEGKKERLLEGEYILAPEIRKRPRKLERFICVIGTQKPIPGTLGEAWQTDEEKDFKLEMELDTCANHPGTCIAIIPRGEVHFRFTFLLGL